MSSNILTDSVTATGLGIAFYHGLTGVACVMYFRKAIFKACGPSCSPGSAPRSARS